MTRQTRRRLRRSLRGIAHSTALALLILSVVSASLPPGLLPSWLPSAAPTVADAETLSSPRYASAAVMPNGNVGLLFTNITGGSSGEIRFVRYTSEHAIASSVQLSTAYPWYPQLVTFGSTLVAAYIDTRSPNQGKFMVRTSTDNGASWSSEAQLFSGETFNSDAFAPRVVASHAGTTLYVFTAVNGQKPKYRSSTDSTLATWSSAVDAGDSSMRVAAANNCGSAGQECYRAHAFGFMETATSGSWVYISKSDSGWGQSGRGTQVGTLGGSWSTQVDHLGSGGLSGGGDGTATTFLDRSGNVYFIRSDERGYGLYFKKSTDGGSTWGSQVDAYSPSLPLYTTAAPVGLYVSGYTFGEYLWYAGFGGSEDTLRVVPLWTAANTYSASGTVRLAGSAGGDLDPSSAYPFNFGDAVAELGAGGYNTSETDLALPGRKLPFAFTRSYSSGNTRASALGPSWSYGFDWQVVDNDPLITVFRGDGSRVRYTRSGTTYTPEVGVFDVLTKTSGLYTLTTRDQVKFAFNSSNKLATITEPAGNAITLTYSSGRLSQITDTVGRAITLAYDGAGLLATLTDNTGRVVRYGYDSAGRLDRVWDRGAIGAEDYARTVLDDSPAGYWRLGESNGTSAADAGPNALTGTYSGGYTLGVSGAPRTSGATAVTLNGSTGKVSAGTTGIPTGAAARTVEAWIKPGSSGGTIFASNASSSQRFILLDALISGTWYLFTDGYNGSNNLTLTGAEIPTVNTWSHVAFVFDGPANTWHYYLNGALVKSGTFPNNIITNTATSVTIGDRLDYPQPFGGSLQEVAEYPAALSWSQIASHYRATVPSWRYGYDGTSAHLTTITDPDGRVVVTNTYSAGRLATQKNGLNKTTTFAASGSTVTITDPRGHDTVSTFDSRSRPLTVADVIGGTTYTTTFTYDDCGNRSNVTDRRGNRTDYTYDTACAGNLETLQEAQLDPYTARFETSWTYDSKNNPTLRTDAKGFTTAWTYDGTTNVRLSQTQQIDGGTNAVTKWIYGDSGNPGLPTRIVFPRGNTTGTPNNTYSTVLAYDSSGNLTSSTDADGNQTTYAYDTLGRRTSMVDPDGNVTGGTPSQHTWSTAYDALDRVTSETDPLSHATAYTYDGAGHRTSVTNKNGNITTSTYDAAGQLATVAQKPDSSGSPSTIFTTTLARDDNGNVTSTTQGNGVVTDYAYDVVNQNTSMTTHPTGGSTLVTSYTFDANGNIATRTTADSVVTTYTRDNLDRLTAIAASGLSTISYGYDELSLRTSMVDVTGTTTYTYDRMGRLTQAAQPNGTTSYVYDLDSNRTTLTYPGSSAVTYYYSYAGRLSSLTDWGSRSSSYTYTAAGLAATVTLPNSMVTTYTYDRAQRLTNLTNVISSTTITSHAYTLDSEGNRTALAEFVSGITTPSTTNSFGMTYDGLERLTGVTTTNAESFTLDGASNITARTGPTKTFTIDGSNRPTSDGTNTLTWSTADRLTGRGSDTFGFDPLDRMTSSTVSSTARTYAYNGDGLLQSRTTGGSTVNLLWDPTTSPSRLLVSGSDKVVYGLGPLYSVNSSTVTTYARDGQKSVRAELNGSAVTSSWRYRAYGDVVQNSGAATPSILGYAGQLLDPSGLYYMRARWYDPVQSRFLSRDPVTREAGAGNGFDYANGSPLQLADPSGLAATTDGDGGACVDENCRDSRGYSTETMRAALAALQVSGSDENTILTSIAILSTIVAPEGLNFTKAMTEAVNELGDSGGCAVRGPNCLSIINPERAPGTASGNWVRGHTVARVMNRARSVLGLPQISGTLQPECVNCSSSFGGRLSQLGKLVKGIDLEGIKSEIGRLSRLGIGVGGSSGWNK
jgi:RHS repeat-associated protein